MSKSDITVTCVFKDKGEDADQIIINSFSFFLKRELTSEGHKTVLQELSPK